jgi:hypothetical protein
MKPIFGLLCFALATLTVAPLSAQSPEEKDQEQLTAIVLELQTQQKTMAENQAKFDEKLAKLAETLRQARIYASRGGR